MSGTGTPFGSRLHPHVDAILGPGPDDIPRRAQAPRERQCRALECRRRRSPPGRSAHQPVGVERPRGRRHPCRARRRETGRRPGEAPAGPGKDIAPGGSEQQEHPSLREREQGELWNDARGSGERSIRERRVRTSRAATGARRTGSRAASPGPSAPAARAIAAATRSDALRFEVDDVVGENMRNPRGPASPNNDHRRRLLHELTQHAPFSLIRIAVDEPNHDRCRRGIAVDRNGASIAARRECCREFLGSPGHAGDLEPDHGRVT